MERAGRGKQTLPRAVLVALFLVAMSATVIRTAAVTALADRHPVQSGTFWPDHPAVLSGLAMTAIAGAAGTGGEPDAEALERLARLAAASPLAPEPYLVQAALALRRGQTAEAEQLLLRARQLDPRGPAARFLLADLYLRSGKVLDGLSELSVLSRLVPGAIEQAAPALALYASSPGAAPRLREILRSYPELQPALVSQLAQDARNSALILQIVDPRKLTERDLPWRKLLIEQLVEAGRFGEARAAWARLSGVRAMPAGLFNPGFDASDAPPPFNWALASSASGIAEPRAGGLRVLYYGREDAALASQIVLLQPGRYRLQMRISGQSGPGVAWTVTCLPGKLELLRLPVDRGVGGMIAADFTVPSAGCAAQRIALVGLAAEFAEAADFRVEDLRLTRIGG